MVVLGVVLVLLAFGVGALLVAGTASLDGTVDVSVPGGTLSLPPLTFLVLGMVVITVFWLGWAILRGGVRRGRRRRHEAKEAEARRVAEEKRLKEEFAARERALLAERDRPADASHAGGAGSSTGDASRTGGGTDLSAGAGTEPGTARESHDPAPQASTTPRGPAPGEQAAGAHPVPRAGEPAGPAAETGGPAAERRPGSPTG